MTKTGEAEWYVGRLIWPQKSLLGWICQLRNMDLLDCIAGFQLAPGEKFAT